MSRVKARISSFEACISRPAAMYISSRYMHGRPRGPLPRRGNMHRCADHAAWETSFATFGSGIVPRLYVVIWGYECNEPESCEVNHARSDPYPRSHSQELDALAAGLLQDLRAIRERIPHFVLPHASHPKLTGLAMRVPQAAVDAAFAACGAKAALAKSIDMPATRPTARSCSHRSRNRWRSRSEGGALDQVQAITRPADFVASYV